MKLKCNWQARPVLAWYELTAKEQKEFDYLDSDDKQQDAQFMRYKGWVYDLGEFMWVAKSIAPHPQRPNWEKFDGYASDSYFSGVLVKYVNDYEEVIAATYYS